MRFVVDTNLLVSGLLFAGVPRQLIEVASTGGFELCTSETLLSELLDVLGRPKFAGRLDAARVSASELVHDIRRLAVVVTPVSVPRIVPNDPDDDHVIAAAIAAGADLIASGDRRDLLPLGSYNGIPIMSAREALDRLGRGPFL